MTDPVLFVDIDSTLYDLVPSLCRAAYEETGEVSEPEDFDRWDYLKSKYGEEVSHRVFDNVLSPDSVSRRIIYPGSHLTLRALNTMGLRIIFCSHNHDPHAMIEPLTKWLSTCYWSEPEVIVVTKDVSKVELLLDYDHPVGIIDDKPSTLIEAVNVNLMAATIRQRWNEEVIRENPEILSFASWYEVFKVKSPVMSDIMERCSMMGSWYSDLGMGGFIDE